MSKLKIAIIGTGSRGSNSFGEIFKRRDDAEIVAVCDLNRKEIQPNSTAEHGLMATAIGQAAEISRREHRMVEIEELFK